LECEWNGKQLPDKLTTTEFLIVKELAKRPGIIKERAQLMDIAYREDTDIEDRTIDSHVKRIRKKFKDAKLHKMVEILDIIFKSDILPGTPALSRPPANRFTTSRLLK
ncbi:winged helix-turn-helix domain-containing protein, partial [Desulfobacula sp.]|uniref:winged helix-turn-helix domain-containing protein n=1 Tax=Desulfobacula sp. TaxID=2593537 RepID=UPI0039B959E7